MDGVFGRQRFTKGFNIIGFLSGVILVLLFGFFICAGEPVSLDDIVASWFFVCFGFFTSILCGGSLYVNRKAYIHVDARGISGFCHFGLSLKCDFSDVSSVSYGGTGLNIQLIMVRSTASSIWKTRIPSENTFRSGFRGSLRPSWIKMN